MNNLKGEHQLFMRLLHKPWSAASIMYEDNTVAPSVAMVWEEKNNNNSLKDTSSVKDGAAG